MQNDNLTAVLAFASMLAVFVFAGVEGIKRSINVPKNALPVIGLIIGLIVGAFATPFTDLDLTMRLWSGGIAGLSATGLFELAFSNRVGTTKEE